MKSFPHILSLVVAMALLGAGSSREGLAVEPGDGPRLEIKKFRFKRHSKKNFERLVVEFSSKGGYANPNLRTDTPVSGREATVFLDNVALVGAIPEVLINESYVPKSKLLGPVSINTDGPTPGFSVRTFLKEPVGFDAFWLASPPRLVLDVFPANSPRVDNRIPVGYEERDLARVKPEHSSPKKPEDDIVCYPISSAVSATVSFHPSTMPSPALQPEGSLFAQPGATEAVICFLASSRVTASVAYKPKALEVPNYVQWDPRGGNQLQQRPGMGGASMFGSAPPNANGMAPGARPPASVPAPPIGGAKPPLPPTSKGPASLVVPDVSPGKTPLGSPLQNPTSVQRLPSYPPPAKLPAGGAKTPPPGLASGGLLPPLK